jgi:hypothetical protein
MLGGLSAKKILPHVSFRLSVDLFLCKKKSVDLFTSQMEVVVLRFHTLQLVGLVYISKTSYETSYVYSSKIINNKRGSGSVCYLLLATSGKLEKKQNPLYTMLFYSVEIYSLRF